MTLQRTIPPFRADHVGSLLRPASLLHAREQRARGEIDAGALRSLEDAAVREVVALQESVGLQSITDGEFRRGLWHADFLASFANVEITRAEVKVRFHSEKGEFERAPTTFRVTGKLSRPSPIFVDDFKFLKTVAHGTPKITIPSPSILHFRLGRSGIDKTAYPELAEFYADLSGVYRQEIGELADAGCRYLQIDEVDFAYLCDPVFRGEVERMGEDPEKLPHTYAKLINDSIAGNPSDMVFAMHLCRGNFESAWLAEGGYDPVAEVLFNEIDVSAYLLEYDTPRAGSFEPLQFVPKGKTVVLGLVTTKNGALEDKDTLKRRIDEASKFVPLDQLAISPQCGFASGARGNNLTVDDERAKLRLIVEVAREVWG